ncbi:MAG TPA: hypothetical protein VFC78_23205 [Tepidisphaeraceae bacterium]|nr:hypothetical protein [Tepidisphaeraceae bacterium]
MNSTNGDSLPTQDPPARRGPQCRGSGRVLLLTSAGPCAACGGTGIAGGNAAGMDTPIGPVSRKYNERGRLVSEEWLTSAARINCFYDPETGNLIQVSETSLEASAARLTTYSYH